MWNLNWHFGVLVQRILITCFPSCLIIMHYHNTGTIPPLYSRLLLTHNKRMSTTLLPEDKNIPSCTGVGGEGVNICQTQASVGNFTLVFTFEWKSLKAREWNKNCLRYFYSYIYGILACIWCSFELRFAVTRMYNRFISALILMHNNEVGARKQFYSNWAIKQPPVPNRSPPGLRRFQK